MSWDFVWGLLVGSCLGFLIAGLIAAGHDDNDYAEPEHVDEKEEVEE